MSINISKIKKLPGAPGVYFFLGKNKRILYIGKATSLRDRARSYLAKDIETTRSPLIAQMIDQARTVDFRVTDSVLEALVLEADLIRKFKPEFNTKEKDDKSFICVVVTKDDFPIITLARKKDIDNKDYKYIFGPYPESNSIKEGLKIIRKIFPYRDDKCVIGRPCFNYQIGLCPGTCIGQVSKKQYSVIIRNIRLFLQGKKGKLITLLNKEMSKAVKAQDFELAAKKRNQIFALEHIRDVSLMKRYDNNSNNYRIEAYDIAHMNGKDMVGAMVVMENGYLQKSQYRKFNIKKYNSSNDTGSLREILERRISHSEWPIPEIIVVDGGQAQLNVAKDVFKDSKVKCVGVTKDDKHKAKEIIGEKSIIDEYRDQIIAINAECHRFTISFHKSTRNKRFLAK